MNEEQEIAKYDHMVQGAIRKAGGLEAWKKGLAGRGRKGGLAGGRGRKKKGKNEPKNS